MLDAAGPDPAFAARYRTPAPQMAWSPVIESLLGHRSVRAYLDRPLAPGTLEALVAAAQSAATSSNLQAWSVVAVEDPARKQRLAELAGNQAHVAQAPLFLAWIADLSRADRLGQAAGQTMEGLPYLEAVLVAVIDAALAAQNAVAAAESLGLGTVYIGGLRNHPEAVAETLGLPPRAFAVFGLCVGHPDPARPAAVKPRLPQSVVLHRERYGAPDEAGDIAAYDRALLAFQAEQRMGAQGWSRLILSRLGLLKNMNGRERLKEALASLGLTVQ
jgi:nitroreductase